MDLGPTFLEQLTIGVTMKSFGSILILLSLFFTITAAQSFKLSPGDTLTSVSVSKERILTLRIYAPEAAAVSVGGPDIPDQYRRQPMIKTADGVWEWTAGPLNAGAYRYQFTVNGLAVNDPKNPSVSESNGNSWSMLSVPGASFMETANVPHGAVSEVQYYSTSLQRSRRMHVYTPPGYESGSAKYPVLYLLHGAMDCDDSWTSVGRAGVIMDNLIAAGKAVPMIVVMPAGHTGPYRWGMPLSDPKRDEFTEDFRNDIRPAVEKRYRTINDQQHRAIAGLSMGGLQTLNIAIPDLADYSAIGVFSSGIFELGGMNFGAPGPSWEERHTAVMSNAALKKGLRTIWFATGKDDFLLNVSQKSVDLLKKYGFTVEYKVTGGGHTWENWREYLRDFTPLLFH